jgi:hypothetical protein
MEFVVLFVALGGFVALIILLLRWVKKQNIKKVKLFAEFAQKHGFEHSTSKYLTAQLNSLSGQKGTNSISITEEMVGSGKSKTVITTLMISPTPFDFEFTIGKEQFFSKAVKLLGFDDVNFDDPEFDKVFLIKSKEEDKLKAIITYEIQAELKRIAADLKGTIYGKSGTISYSITGPLMKPAQLESFENVMLFLLQLITARR